MNETLMPQSQTREETGNAGLWCLDHPSNPNLTLCGLEAPNPDPDWFPDAELPEENTCPQCLRLKVAKHNEGL